MKAVVITTFGGPEVLQVQEIEEPVAGPEDIKVSVRTTALNRADLLQRLGRYPAPQGVRPDVPGLEFAGVVEEVGAQVQRFKAGDRVMGLLPGAGYAEKVVTPAELALPIPANLDFIQAAAIPEVFMTAYDALQLRLKIQAGETLLIHAVASGVGLAALQLAKHAGLCVLGTAGSNNKLDKARAFGLDVGINYKSSDFMEVVQSYTRGGVDCILDVVGAPYWQRNLACLKSRGRMVLVGLLGGNTVEIDLATILSKRLHIIGTVLRSRPVEEKIALNRLFAAEVLPLFEQGKLTPVIDQTFPLQQVAAAHRYMQENRNAGKIVLQVSGPER